MSDSIANMLHDWRDFYALAGAASATLIGLMFVMASIGVNFFKERHRDSLKAFVTPTVVHFATVLFTCLVAIMPAHSWRSLGGLLGAAGIAGSVYCGRILVQIVIRRRFKVDLDDRLFYALVPTLGYLVMMGSAALLFMQSEASGEAIAAALLILLAAGIRNGWDMTIWIAVPSQPREEPPP